jgi:hypothetical protein
MVSTTASAPCAKPNEHSEREDTSTMTMQRLVSVEIVRNKTQEQIIAEFLRMGITREAVELELKRQEKQQMFRNNIYTVLKIEQSGGLTHLSIRRNDRKAAKDWRHFQQIKNELCGEEREGVEIYPAESRLVDMSNQYHMWVLPAGDRIGIGFNDGRKIMDKAEAERAVAGCVQRAFDDVGK